MKQLKRSYFKPKLYVSAKVRSPNHQRNNTTASYLRGLFDIFLPHEHQVCDAPHEDLPLSVYMMDLTAMEHSDLAVLVPPYGKDCAWEIGWFKAKDVPVFVFVQEDLSFLSDAMVIGGVTALFTSNQEVYQRLMLQPVTRHKTYFLSEPQKLGVEVLRFYNDINGGTVLMEHS